MVDTYTKILLDDIYSALDGFAETPHNPFPGRGMYTIEEVEFIENALRRRACLNGVMQWGRQNEVCKYIAHEINRPEGSLRLMIWRFRRWGVINLGPMQSCKTLTDLLELKHRGPSQHLKRIANTKKLTDTSDTGKPAHAAQNQITGSGQ